MAGPTKTLHVLFFNVFEKPACGVYQYGLRLFRILEEQGRKDQSMTFEYHCLRTPGEYGAVFAHPRPKPFDYVFHNHYFYLTRGWLHAGTIQRKIPNIGLDHDQHHPGNLFDLYVKQDPDLSNGLPRPLFEPCRAPIPTSYPGIPVIGSFGLNYPQKGWDDLVRQVNKEFDHAVIRLHLPSAAHLPAHWPAESNQRILQVPRKPGIQVVLTHELLSDDELLKFLAANDINVFLYQPNSDDGPNRISSVIDYALSVDRPLCLSDSPSFKHVLTPQMRLSGNSIRQIMESGIQHLKPFRTRWANRQLFLKFYSLLTSVAARS